MLVSQDKHVRNSEVVSGGNFIPDKASLLPLSIRDAPCPL